MLFRTNQQNSRFHTLIHKRKLTQEEKQELVKEFTGGRESSSTKMTIDEMAALIDHLEDENQASIKRMRSKIINIAKDIFAIEEMTQRHWDALNKFLQSKYKAPLHKLYGDELRNAVTSLEKWRDGETKKMINDLLTGF